MASPLETLMAQDPRASQHKMFSGIRRTVDATVEPVDILEVKNHIRLEPGITEDDALINALITAARTYVENDINRSLVSQTWQIVFDHFPNKDELWLPKGPLISVTSITTYDEANTASVLSTAAYFVDTYGDRVSLVYGYSWPTDLRHHNGVVIEYVTGYGTKATDIPQPIKQAMLMLVGHWYENREATSYSKIDSVPMAVGALLAQYKRSRL